MINSQGEKKMLLTQNGACSTGSYFNDIDIHLNYGKFCLP